ncbi:MAG: hydroxymethylglutaryl-CoA lyase [Gammaproteobacteria bacterium]|nr:hydroxymethylglutaryl-CoA lyase [Gammaproteobacteria bacterium]
MTAQQDTVTIVEVGPRDGLQAEARALPAADRIRLIELLVDSGLKHIESGSFVSPKWVPQMAESDAVLRGVPANPGVHYPVLVPNLRGLELALAAGAREIAVFTAASETFCQRNTNCTIGESLQRFEPVLALAAEHGVPVRGYVSCVLGCPYQGEVGTGAVIEVATALAAMGCYEVCLADTIGVGTPRRARALISAAAEQLPLDRLAVHFHDTYGQALANVLACLEIGIRTVDSAVAGLGGCPYAPGAAGNLATEDLVYMLDGMGLHTGVDLDRLIEAGTFICERLGRRSQSRVQLARQGRGTRVLT